MGGFVGHKGKGEMRCILIISKIKEIILKQEKSKHRLHHELIQMPTKAIIGQREHTGCGVARMKCWRGLLGCEG